MTTTITTVFAVIGGIAATVPAVATAYLKGREALSPLLSRRSLRVVIVATEEKQPAAIAFANALRGRGYREVALTRVPEAAGGAHAVVMWELGASDVPTALRAAAASPEAIMCVLTYDALQGLPRGPKWLLCNSPVRLRGDLAAIAEGC